VPYLLTYLLTPWSRVLLEKLIGFQLVNKFPHFVEIECSLPHSQVSGCTFRNKIRFYGEELLAPRPTSKLEDHPLSAVRECLFNIFAATLHIGDRSSILNLRTRSALVTGTPLSQRHMKWYLFTAIVFPPGGSGR